MKKSFTLAEVLITLGILGVVIAMTLPSIVANYKRKVTVNKLKKFYTVMSQATNMAIVENGPIDSWDGFTSSNNGEEIERWFEQYLEPNLKILNKMVDRNENGSKGLYVFFNDGTIMKLTNWAGNTPDIDDESGTDNNHVNDNFNGLVHVSYITEKKALKTENRKECVNTFTFLFYNPLKKQYSFFPYAYQANTPEKYNRDFFIKQIENGNSQYCTALIMYDGWEIRDDYPYKYKY